MTNRRALIEGIASRENIDPDLAEEFISGRKPQPARRAPQPPAKPAVPSEVKIAADIQAPQLAPIAEQPTSSPFVGVSRIPVGARVRTELASALKRASLERQLKGLQPCSVQDILEDALALWLLKNGHGK